MTSPHVVPSAPPEPALSAVWTRPRIRWRRGLRAAVASLGTCAAPAYFFGVRGGVLSWPAAIALDLGVAALTGVLALDLPWTRHFRVGSQFGAMLETTAVLPWFAGAAVAGLLGLVSGLVLRSGDVVAGLAAAGAAAAAWSWGFTAWWTRCQRPPPP